MCKFNGFCLSAVFWVAALMVLSACSPEMVPPPDPTAIQPSPSAEVQSVPAEIIPGSKITPGTEIDPGSGRTPGTAIPPVKPGDLKVEDLPAFQPVRAYITEKLGIAPEEIVLLSYEPVDWPDSCLGVSQPGVACLDVITPGYLLFFETPQGRIEAHLDKSGRNFKLIPSLAPALKGLPTSPPGTPGASGIRGQALVGPACPGPVSADNPCPDQPIQATISVLGLNGETVTQFQTDGEGYFQIELPPGKYILHPESPGKLPIGIDQEIVVPSGQYVEITIQYDSGIR